MSKHSRNNTNGSVFTYRERKMAGIQEYGTQKTRMGQDSALKFGLCSMYLHEIQEPMSCTKGHLFCKICVIENLVKQKQDNEIQLQKYNEQEEKKKQEENINKEEIEKKEKQFTDFSKLEDTFDPKTRQEYLRKTTLQQSQVKQLSEREEHDQYIFKDANKTKQEQIQNCFWMPETRENVLNQIKKPDMNLKCPSTRDHQVKLKKLVKLDIKQTKIKEEKGLSFEYSCHLCNKQLQYQKIGASKKCGHVGCFSCIQTAFKESKSCGVCMKKFEADDIIELQSSQSSFSSHNDVTAKQFQHSMIC